MRRLAPARLRLALSIACLTSACSASQAAKILIKTIPVSKLESAAMRLPDELIQANFNLADATRNLVRKATELPPPGVVKLSDLDANLKTFEGKPETDFLVNAKDDDGKALDFQYARFNEPSYDAFLKQAAIAKALSRQTLGTVQRMVEIASDILGETVTAGPSLHRTVEQALARGSIPEAQKRQLEDLQKLGRSLGVLVPRFAKQAHELGQAGQQLIANVSTVFSNSRVLAHLPEVSASLLSSVQTIALTGRWTAEIAVSLRGFSKTGGAPRHEVDIEEGRLDREELSALLFEP